MRLSRVAGALALLGVGAVLLSTSLLVPVGGISAPYSALNPGADGLSRFASELHGRSVFATTLRVEQTRATLDSGSFAERSPSSEGALVVVEPETEASERERAWLRDFVRGGGVLVVAGTTSVTDSFLEPVAESRIDPRPVRDLAYSRAPGFPFVQVRSDEPLLGNVSALVLNHPASVRPGPGALVLASTSAHAFRAAVPAGASAGPLPWLVREEVGEGTVLVLSDPNLLTNGMAGVEDADVFVRNLVSLLAEGGRVVVDEGHRASDPYAALARVSFQSVPPAIRIGVALALYAAIAVPLVRSWRPDLFAGRAWERLLLPLPRAAPPTREALRAELMRRHPDWDAARLDAVLGSWREPR